MGSIGAKDRKQPVTTKWDPDTYLLSFIGSNDDLPVAGFSSDFTSSVGILNVKAAPFFAKGDGITNDTAAIQAAINAVSASTVGGNLYFPPGTYLHTGLTLNAKRNITLLGPAFNSGALPYGAELRYTSTGSGLAIDCGISYGIQFKRIFLSYSHASFTGRLLDFRGSASVSTQFPSVDECALYGNGGRSAQSLIDLDRADQARITNSFLLNANLGIQGGINYSNSNRIEGNTFVAITSMPIRDMGESWSVTGNTFSVPIYNAGNVGPAGAIDHTAGSVKPRGCLIQGNWFGDIADPGSGTWIDIWGNGYTIIGNTFNLTTGTTAMKFTQNSNTGIIIMGNTFERNGAGGANPRGLDFDIFTGQTGLMIGPNDVFGTLTEVVGMNAANGMYFNSVAGQVQLGKSFFDVSAGFYVAASATPITQLIIYTPTLSPAIVNANTTAEQTFTVTGLTTADKIMFVEKPTAQAGLGIVGHRVSAADTLAITFSNNTGVGITPTASQVYKVGAIRS